MEEKQIENIDDYISRFPLDIQKILHKLRDVIRDAAPEAIETISYQMPTFKLNQNLVHFAAYKSHIGFYPTPEAIIKFKDRISKYKSSKGAIQFKVDEPLPYDLIIDIVKHRVEMAKKLNN